MKIIEHKGIIIAKGVDMDAIAGSDEYGDEGWNPMWGEINVVRHIVPNLSSDQRVVDLAGAIGRVSFPFSMRGYDVTIVDINADLLREGNLMRKKAGAKPAQTLKKDIRKVTKNDVGPNVGAVVACDALMFLGKEDAVEVLENMPKLLGDKGGYLYLSVPATESPLFIQPSRYGAVSSGEKTLRVPAGCHGGTIESGFFDMGEVDARLALCGAINVSSELVERGRGPIMYHEILARFSSRNRR